MTTKELLQRAKALISDPDNWTQGDLQEGGAYCAMGALCAADGEAGRKLLEAEVFPGRIDWFIDRFGASPEEQAEFETLRAANELLVQVASKIVPRRADRPLEVVWHVNDTLPHEVVMKMFDDAIRQAD